RADHEQLLRHAAADHAGATHPVFFGDHDASAVTGGDAGGANPARTSSDHKQVDVEFSHGHPARIPIFDAFSSREPVSTSLENAMEIRSGKSDPGNQICLPRLRISARNWALTISAKLCAHWFI